MYASCQQRFTLVEEAGDWYELMILPAHYAASIATATDYCTAVHLADTPPVHTSQPQLASKSVHFVFKTSCVQLTSLVG